MTTDPTGAWEITRAVQGEPEVLIDLDIRSAPGVYTDTPPPKREGTVRFVCISDTHSYESKAMSGPTTFDNIPDGDVLLHCGDFTNIGRLEEMMAFAKWFGALPHKRKIIIAGNHDLSLHGASYAATSNRFGGMGKLGEGHDAVEVSAKARAIIAEIPDSEYLMDSGTSVEGIKVWGSPWQPEFCDWAFNLPRGAACRQKWALIPEGTDVVLTHGPPLGHGDECCHGGRAGCADLLDELQRRVKPQYHCFGHIHEGWGVTTDGVTRYVNASTCNIRYKPINQPIVFDVDIPKTIAAEMKERLQYQPAATAAAAPAPATPEATCVAAESGSAKPALTPAALLENGRYVHATCGMHTKLLARLRPVAKEAAGLRRVCSELADKAAERLQLGSSRAAVIVAPPIGPPTCVVGDEDPLVVIWLMLDPLDIDSKQTTFCRGSEAQRFMTKLYKWAGSAMPPPHTPLPNIEEGESTAAVDVA